MRCSKCGAENPDRAKFCESCASPFTRRCPSCATENSPGAKFCIECAKPLERPSGKSRSPAGESSSIQAGAASPDASLEGERKTVTALFADIKGSMELIEDLDPEKARAIIDPALKLMMEAVQHYGGYVAQSTGDGIFALFGAPVAHEDHPQRALYAAVRMQEELKRYSDRIRAEGRLPIQARVGVNTGEVVVRSISTGEGRSEYVPVGHSAGIAARMQALAPVGSIAATEPIRKLCDGYFVFKSLGPTKVKGVTEPVNVHEVTGLGPLRTRLQRAVGRGLSKFVGRAREMEALSHAGDLVKRIHGQVVAAIAEPGVGKSRLFFEFKATSQTGWLVLEAFSVSHGKATSYLPLIDLLHTYFGIDIQDDARKRREKVAGRIAMLDSVLEDTRPYIFALLGIVESDDPLAGMDHEIRRRRTQDALKRILLSESLHQPLMLIFEDLQWMDEETLVFLNQLVEGMANARVLLLVSYRPEFSHQWSNKTYYAQLRLDPLGQKSAYEMISAWLGESAELASLKRLIIERTDGNPLFVEELTNALFDEGVLVRNGTIRVTRPLNQLRIPPTVQGILAARIDRLPPEEKELLQTLAVIGVVFPLSLVREVVQRPADSLERMLSTLQSGEFIYEQPAAADFEYTFKHALTHDVAYNSLLINRRTTLHECTATAIERLYRERLEDQYVNLSYHYSLSNRAAKAVEYLRLAGEQAMDRGGYAKAQANVELALKLIEKLPEGPERLRAELGIRLLQGLIVTFLFGVSSTERLQTYERVAELSERLDDASALILGLFNLAFVCSNRREATRGQEIARRCLGLAERHQNLEMMPYIHTLIGWCAYGCGDLLVASSEFSEVMKRPVSPEHPAIPRGMPSYLSVLAPAMLAQVQQALGKPDEALKLGDEALRRAHSFKNSFTLAGALSLLATERYELRDAVTARALSETLIEVAEKYGFQERLSQGRLLRGWAQVMLGHIPVAAAELEVGAASRSLLQMETILVQLYLLVGRAREALVVINDTLARTELSGAHIVDAELYRLKAEAILMLGASATVEAEACLRKAIEIARGQSARWWELRAAVNLARLLRDTNRHEEARAMLAEIYNWFTEGFDTADLKEAKALLEELSPPT
jgi:class 3 adenylate cyclase/tetratricopeptide (TPR) repeat protein